MRRYKKTNEDVYRDRFTEIHVEREKIGQADQLIYPLAPQEGVSPVTC